MKIKVLYNKFDRKIIQNFTERLLLLKEDIQIYEINYKGKVDIIMIFADDILTLKYLISLTKKKEKIAIVTSNINANYLVKCIDYSTCVCYLKGNMNLIVKKLEALQESNE